MILADPSEGADMAVDYVAETTQMLEARIATEDDVLVRLQLRTELIEFLESHPRYETHPVYDAARGEQY